MNRLFSFIKVLIAFLWIFLIYFNISYSQVNPIWQVSFNDSIPESNYAVKSKLDKEGNIIILAEGTNGSGSSVDYVVIKYSPAGLKLWNRRFDGTGHSSDYPIDMVIDKYNNIYVTGRSWGGSATRNDYLTLKYSSEGELLWSRRFNWVVSRNDEAYSLALDSNENVYVTGFATGAYNGNELWDMVTVKYNSSGEQKWVKSFAGFFTSADWGYTVVCDLSGNIYVSGFTISSSFLNYDIITVKYDSLGNEIWQRRFNNKGDDYIRPLFSKTDHLNNLVIASYYKTDSTYIDYLTYKYDSSGNLLWSRIYDGGVQSGDWINDLIIDSQNNVYITGSSWNIGTGFDLLTIKYSPYGKEVWQNSIKDSTDDQTPFISIDSHQNISILATSIFFSGEYGTVSILNNEGRLISKFRNNYIKISASINVDQDDKLLIVGNYGSKTVTAKYLNIINGINAQNISFLNSTSLIQNFPNPYNPRTKIRYQLSVNGLTTLKVYDILGNKVVTLVNEIKNAGSYSIEFDGTNYSSGIYLYSLFLNGSFIDTKRMFLIK